MRDVVRNTSTIQVGDQGGENHQLVTGHTADLGRAITGCNIPYFSNSYSPTAAVSCTLILYSFMATHHTYPRIVIEIPCLNGHLVLVPPGEILAMCTSFASRPYLGTTHTMGLSQMGFVNAVLCSEPKYPRPAAHITGAAKAQALGHNIWPSHV